MLNTVDLYLGTFLVLSGFALSLLNLRRIVTKNGSSFSQVLISENILLTCVGVAFVSRSVYEINLVNMDMADLEERSAEMINSARQDRKSCDFWYVLKSYGPLIVSFVNSFVSLLIDNYLHYRLLETMKDKDEENVVQEIGQGTEMSRQIEDKKLLEFIRKYFSFIAIVFQWILPILMVLSMYFMGVKEEILPMSNLRALSNSCMAMLDVSNETCFSVNNITTLELRKYIPTSNYLEEHENDTYKNNMTNQLNSVIQNVYKIVTDLKSKSNLININVTSPHLFRKSKLGEKCIKLCFLENKHLLLYMFMLAIVSYFVPITISTVILTKIYAMDVKSRNRKTYVSRELWYNILFWTPIMFDTLLSLVLCSYSSNGIRTSLFNVIANVYQAVKNVMNTKYFKDNTVDPL